MKFIAPAVCYLELKSELRQFKDYLFAPVFYLVVFSLYPIAFGPHGDVLIRYFPAMSWIAIILSVLISLRYLFEQEFQQGMVEQLILNQQSVIVFMLCKLMINWLLTCVPLFLVIPVAGLFFNQTATVLLKLELSFMVVTPILYFLGMLMASLTLGIQQKNIIFSLTLMPFYIPVMALAVLFVNSHQVVSEMIFILLLGILFVLSIICSVFSVIALKSGVSH